MAVAVEDAGQRHAARFLRGEDPEALAELLHRSGRIVGARGRLLAVGEVHRRPGLPVVDVRLAVDGARARVGDVERDAVVAIAGGEQPIALRRPDDVFGRAVLVGVRRQVVGVEEAAGPVRIPQPVHRLPARAGREKDVAEHGVGGLAPVAGQADVGRRGLHPQREIEARGDVVLALAERHVAAAAVDGVPDRDLARRPDQHVADVRVGVDAVVARVRRRVEVDQRGVAPDGEAHAVDRGQRRKISRARAAARHALKAVDAAARDAGAVGIEAVGLAVAVVVDAVRARQLGGAAGRTDGPGVALGDHGVVRTGGAQDQGQDRAEPRTDQPRSRFAGMTHIGPPPVNVGGGPIFSRPEGETQSEAPMNRRNPGFGLAGAGQGVV